MTREEAIGRIQEHRRIHSKKEPFTPYLDKAFDMAIEALKDRPHGEWLISPDKTRACCPFCHHSWRDADEIALLDTAFRAKNFCEYCGADMRPKEGETE